MGKRSYISVTALGCLISIPEVFWRDVALDVAERELELQHALGKPAHPPAGQVMPHRERCSFSSSAKAARSGASLVAGGSPSCNVCQHVQVFVSKRPKFRLGASRALMNFPHRDR